MNVATTWPLAADVPLQETAGIASVGVIGAGQMGNGIAHVCALAGIPVVLLDVAQAPLDKAVSVVGRNLERQVKKGALTAAAMQAALTLITTSTDYAAFAGVDLVVEAATENEAVKRAILGHLIPHIKPSCIIASNTSSISITRLAAATDRPEKFVGTPLHEPGPGHEAPGDHPRHRDR